MDHFLALLDRNKTKITHSSKLKHPQLYAELVKAASELDYTPVELCWTVLNKADPGQCSVCEKRAKFISMSRGYHATCGEAKCVKTHKSIRLSERLIAAWTEGGDQIREKRESTCVAKFGVAHVLQSPDVRAKSKATNVQRLGEDFGAIIARRGSIKRRATMVARYGVTTPFMLPSSLDSVMAKYGFHNAAQSPDVKSKMSDSAISRQADGRGIYKYKPYTFPSGRVELVQGYEPYAIDLLLASSFDEDDILTSKECPRIRYGSSKYLPDIYIKSKNLLIEVKSTWTFKLTSEKALQKQAACTAAGFRHEIWIMDKHALVKVISEAV